MRRVFADSGYWIALAHLKDQGHQRALDFSPKLARVTLVTTDEVLDEFLAHFSGFGPEMRSRCVLVIRKLFSNPSVEVVAQSRETFLSGLDLYEARADKA